MFTALVNGRFWSADPISISARAGGVPGGVVLVGTHALDGVTTSLTITLGNISGPGTFALGVSSDVYGGTGLVGEARGGDATSWITENTGVAGTVTITRLDTRIVGTFEYVAEPGASGTATGTRTITEGKFDLPLAGTLPPVPDGFGSKVSARFDGVLYNAWLVSGSLLDELGQPGFTLSTATKEHGLSFDLRAVTAPGAYAISGTDPIRIMSAGHRGGDAAHCCWDSNVPGAIGSVIITSLTAKRVQGTFSATLPARPRDPATTPLVITDGAFDVGVH